MKNRNLIKIALLIFVSSILVASFNSCKNSTHLKNLGLQLYSIRDSIKKDLPGSLAKVGGMGYKFVETAGYSDGKFYGLPPAEFKTLCEKNGLNFMGSHTGHPAPDSTNSEETMKWWNTCIEAHVAGGVKWIVQPTLGTEALTSMKDLKRWCDYFNMVGEMCNAKGIRFGYHNHFQEMSAQIDGVTVYDYMIENTDPSKVMFEMDLNWVVVGGKNPVDYFNKYPGRFELWHIADKAELGTSGTMDFASIWAAAAKSGMKYGVVEVEKYNFDEFTSCKKSLEFLNSQSYVVMPE